MFFTYVFVGIIMLVIDEVYVISNLNVNKTVTLPERQTYKY